MYWNWFLYEWIEANNIKLKQHISGGFCSKRVWLFLSAKKGDIENHNTDELYEFLMIQAMF